MKNIEITPEILNLITYIDHFKGQWIALKQLSREKLNSLKKVATIESIGSSTRIEGAKLSDTEIEALLSGLNVNSFRNRDEEEVASYAETLELMFDAYDSIRFDENHIKQLHELVLKFSKKDLRHRGEYKKFPNHVEASNLQGQSLGIIFKTTSPFETPTAMKELVEWTQKQFNEKKFHPLIIIGIFIVNFLAIHPFQDGNGRLSRILTTLLLLQHGYDYVMFSSLESIIEENKEKYYLALRHTQASLNQLNENYEEWLVFFLNALKVQCLRLQKKIEHEKLLMSVQLHPLDKKILDIMKERNQATIRDLVTLTQANRNTLKARINSLVMRELLIQHGKGKGTYYKLKA